MKTDSALQGAIAVIIIVAGVLLVSYLVTTALVWLVLWLLNALWGVEVSTNIWLLSLLVWIVLGVIKQIFSK